jgi:ABC-2 type transport system permease protein
MGGKFGPGLFVLPLLFAIQIVMNVGFALLVSTFVVLFPDGQNFMNYVNRLIFFATPVVYPASFLPSGAKLLVGWQPLFALFSAYQAVFSGKVPSVFLVLQALGWAIALLVIGGNLFLRHEREFALHL